MESLVLIAERVGLSLPTLLLPRETPPENLELVAEELDRLYRAHQYAELMERAQEILGRTSSARLTALGHHYLGYALMRVQRLTEGLAHLVTAREAFEALGDRPWAVESLGWQAVTLYYMQNPRALRLAEEALRQARALESRRMDLEARLLEHLGSFLCTAGDYEQAAACLEEALHASGTIRDLKRLGHIFQALGICRFELGDHERGLNLLQRSLSLFSMEQELSPASARHPLALLQNNLALMFIRTGELDQAEQLLDAAIAELELEQPVSVLLLTFAELRQRQGRLDEALSLVREALEIATRLSHNRTLVSAYMQLGELQALRGEYELADTSFQRSLDLLEPAGVEPRRAEVLEAYQRAMAARDQPAPPAEAAAAASSA